MPDRIVKGGKTKRARQVRHTLMAVTFPVLSFLVSKSLAKLETMVPAEMIMEMIPAQETEAPSSWYILGQADPRRASGSPRLIKER